MDSGIGVNQPITQMIGKNANGCNTWDRGTSSGVTTVTRVLTCNSDGELELTEGTDTGVVTQVECVTAG
uniref:Uncharacterized protein n=1 Tax=Panagrolaimus superbus TaxID=310955 RepID=A0A914YQ03_9BILA